MTKKFILLVLICLIFTCSYASADPFSDVPSDHWSYDAVQMLEEKGLVEGYPDGLFKGDRPMTRYEMAMVVARVVAKLEQIQASIPEIPDLSIYATKEDLELINKLLDEYNGELDALGVRVANVEESLAEISNRVAMQERIIINGLFYGTFQSVGYYPGENNVASFGNANPNFGAGNAAGPAIINANDPYQGLPLFEGTNNTNKLRLFVTAVIAPTVLAGCEFTAYSSFGDPGVRDVSVTPQYNSLGSFMDGNFRATMSTLWFETLGDINIKGTFGDYDYLDSKVSHNLFRPALTPYGFDLGVFYPLNGLNFRGTLYENTNIELFMARNINSFGNYNYPALQTLTNRLYYFGEPAYQQSNPSWYPLATPFNNGAGASHVYSYDSFAPGQYDNMAYGFHGGYDFNEGKGHLEASYVNLYENITTNPSLAINQVAPKGNKTFGFKGYYNLLDNKLKIYGEFNQSRFTYNFLDKTRDSYAGNFFEIGAAGEICEGLTLDGKFIWVDANYNPVGYYNTMEIDYLDKHHLGWDPWKYGSNLYLPMFSSYMPNRKGLNISADWNFGEEKQGLIYGDFTWQNQVEPTMITNDENSFARYDFLTGTLMTDVAGNNFIGANIYGNQDIIFTGNDPARGNQWFMKLGGKYKFGDNLHIWGSFNQYNFARDWELRNLNTELTFSYLYTGVTYDVTDTFSVQGNFGYAKKSGNLALNTAAIGIDKDINISALDNHTFIPGVGVMWQFAENNMLTVDYKYYDYSDETLNGSRNDYSANRVMMRYILSF